MIGRVRAAVDPGSAPTGSVAAVSTPRWYWRLENGAGETVTSGEPEVSPTSGEPEVSFPTQSDAESWVGEQWQALAADGVTAVYLFEDDRKVYGPMSLLPAD